MFHIVLYEPEIPPNTGNIIRLCANSGAQLHLVRPLGFDLDDKKLKRAGLDYHEWASVKVHQTLAHCLGQIQPTQCHALTTKGCRAYTDATFTPGDALLFGPESRGLPTDVLSSISEQQRLYIPMVTESRSLNLSNAAAIVLFEAWRQNGFAGARS